MLWAQPCSVSKQSQPAELVGIADVLMSECERSHSAGVGWAKYLPASRGACVAKSCLVSDAEVRIHGHSLMFNKK